MLFVELRFILFFAAVFILYWRMRSNRNRKILLLVSSYFFYGCWDWRFLGLIFLSSTIDYLAGWHLDKPEGQARRRMWLVISIAANLSVLGIFKYFNFFIESLEVFLSLAGMDFGLRNLNIILPMGISFFTFQSMSYTIDVYRRVIRAEPDPLDFYLYVSFFPQLVAGPIVRAKDFLPQLRSRRRFPYEKYALYCLIFAVGFFKKAVVSDTFALFIDPVFADPAAYGQGSQALAVVLYAIQIYCDFSGYTDMAIAVAGLLGYEFIRNFNAPYLAASMTDFWRRWHISLSSWLKDYLYIPLGGNRKGRLKTYRNLIITMGLGGLWHGASWNFVIWGLLHGAALSVEKLLRPKAGKPHHASEGFPNEPKPSKAPPRQRFSRWAVRLVQSAFTFVFVCFCWIFFRAQTFSDAAVMISGIAAGRTAGADSLPGYLWLVSLALLGVHVLFYHGKYLKRFALIPPWAAAAATGLIMAFSLLTMPLEVVPFIYFQF